MSDKQKPNLGEYFITLFLGGILTGPGGMFFSTLVFGPVPLGYLTDAGPLWLNAVVSMSLVSFSSAGVQISILGMHLK